MIMSSPKPGPRLMYKFNNLPSIPFLPYKSTLSITKQFSTAKTNAISKNLGISAMKSKVSFAQWYKQCITKAELIDYSDVSGCYILRPWAYAIWSNIQAYLSSAFKKNGIQDAYFPLLISEDALRKEQAHVEGFEPEVAWVTQAGDETLNVRLAVRPTSETAIYPAYSRWIKSHRDLPLRLNQWCNVVRWEFDHPQPFIRSREFLWQEGHSAFATKLEADQEVYNILDLYKKTFQELLAVPVIAGRKSQKEKFAGADYTTSIEAFIPKVGKAIQAATSHSLGQNFSKIFDIKFEKSDQPGTMEFAWQNSWGFTTRSIGIAIMTHSDDRGLVLPPMVAPLQVIIIPLRAATTTMDEFNNIINTCHSIESTLTLYGIRVKVDADQKQSAGLKFNKWELKGVPVRLEVGPKEMQSRSITASLRTNGEKLILKRAQVIEEINAILMRIQKELFDKAQERLVNSIQQHTEQAEAIAALADDKLVMLPWCEASSCEQEIKRMTAHEFHGSGAKSLCIPLEQPSSKPQWCFACKEPAQSWTLFGKSY